MGYDTWKGSIVTKGVRAIQSTSTETIICPTGARVLKQGAYYKAKLFGTLDY